MMRNKSYGDLKRGCKQEKHQNLEGGTSLSVKRRKDSVDTK